MTDKDLDDTRTDLRLRVLMAEYQQRRDDFGDLQKDLFTAVQIYTAALVIVIGYGFVSTTPDRFLIWALIPIMLFSFAALGIFITAFIFVNRHVSSELEFEIQKLIHSEHPAWNSRWAALISRSNVLGVRHVLVVAWLGLITGYVFFAWVSLPSIGRAFGEAAEFASIVLYIVMMVYLHWLGISVYFKILAPVTSGRAPILP